MKITPSTNAFLWGSLGLLTLAGIPLSLLRPHGPLGILPAFGGGFACLVLINFAYRQWRTQKIEANFLKCAPSLAIGAGITIVLTYLDKIAN